MKKNKVLKAGIWYTISNFLISGLGFITMPFFTRLMSQDDIGTFSNVASWVSIFSVVFTLNLYSTVQLGKFEFKEKLNSYLLSIAVLGSLSALLFGIILMIFGDFFSESFTIPEYSLPVIVLNLILSPAMNLLLTKFRINQVYIPVAVITILTSVISVAITLSLVVLSEDKLYWRITSSYLFSALVGLGAYTYIIVKGRTISLKHWRFALPIALPIVLHSVSGVILNASDKIMITNICGREKNALYSVAYSCATIISILCYSFNNAWGPWMLDKINDKNYAALKKYSKPYLIFFFLIVFAAMLVAPEVLWILGGDTYLKARFVIPPIMIGFVFNFAYTLYVNIQFYYKKNLRIAMITITAAAINVLLNFIFLPVFGYTAAAYTTLFGFFITFLLNFLAVKKMGLSHIYDTRFNMLYLAVAIASMVLCLLLYQNYIVRYAFIILSMVIFAVAAFKYKNKIFVVLPFLKKD